VGSALIAAFAFDEFDIARRSGLTIVRWNDYIPAEADRSG